MSNISVLLNTMHQFSPKGQEMLLGVLKQNRQVLKREYGFIDIPRILSDCGQINELQKESNRTIRGLAIEILNDYICKFDISKKDKKILWKKAEKVVNITDVNPRGGIAFAATRHFNDKKQKIANLLQQAGLTDILESIESWKTPEETEKYIKFFTIERILFSYVRKILKHDKKAFLKLMFLNIKKRFGLLKNNNNELKEVNYVHDLYTDINKIFVSPSKDRRVRNIEGSLKKKYGIKYANLDNIQDAERILRSVELAKANNIPLPQNIVVTPFLDNSKQGLNLANKSVFVRMKYNDSDILQKIKQLDVSDEHMSYISGVLARRVLHHMSTSSSQHVSLHEIIHGERNPYEKGHKLPKKCKKTIKRLGLYAETNFNKNNEEVRTELKTKKLLIGLTDKENEILNILESK